MRSAKSRLHRRRYHCAFRAARRNSTKFSEKTQFTQLAGREYLLTKSSNPRDSGRLTTLSGKSLRLEKSCTQIEAVTGQQQRHGQTYSTKHGECLDGFDIDLSSRRARKYSCNSSHLRPPRQDPTGEADLLFVAEFVFSRCERNHTTGSQLKITGRRATKLELQNCCIDCTTAVNISCAEMMSICLEV